MKQQTTVADVLQTLVPITSFSTYEKGDEIPLHKFNKDCIIIICSGYVLLRSMDSQGNHLSEFLKIGDTFKNNNIGYRVRASYEVTICSISSSVYDSIIAEHSHLEKIFRSATEKRIERLRIFMSRALYANTEGKLVTFLLFCLSEQNFNLDSGNKRRLLIPMSHQDIGSVIGVSREQVCRSFKLLIRRDLITKESKRHVARQLVTIKNLSALHTLSGI